MAQALLVATCIAMLVQSGQLPQTPGLAIPPGWGSGDVLKCWSSLANTEGCVTSIFSSIFSLNFNSIAPACCKAFVAIDAGCFHLMFPWNPFFPQLLNDFCARIEGGARGVPPSPPVSAWVLGTYQRCGCITYWWRFLFNLINQTKF